MGHRLRTGIQTHRTSKAHAGGAAPTIDVGEVARLSDDKLSARLAETNEDLALTEQALALAASGQYKAALDALRIGTLD